MTHGTSRFFFKKLEYYGIRGSAYNLLESYLVKREQYVKFNNYNSKQIETKSVPQGSILGTLLLCIYINDLVLASDKVNHIMYADDTTLYFTLQYFPSHNLEDIVNYELGKITNWLNFNKLSLNAPTTKSMVLHTKQRHMDAVSFTINNENIEQVSSFSFLGIHIAENFT